MIYAQEKGGQQLHLVCEPGEEYRGEIVRYGHLSQPLCGRKVSEYGMTIGYPLGHACKNCLHVLAAKKKAKP